MTGYRVDVRHIRPYRGSPTGGPIATWLDDVATFLGVDADPDSVAAEIERRCGELARREDAEQDRATAVDPDAVMAVDTPNVVYLAQAHNSGTGAMVLLGISADRLRALAFVGAAAIDRPDLDRPELITVKLDDPNGWDIG
jgi:hypothetical protein